MMTRTWCSPWFLECDAGAVGSTCRGTSSPLLRLTDGGDPARARLAK
jgi:hypothetical protein